MDLWIAYYMFVNHGSHPGEIVNLGFREKALMFAMAEKEISSRSKK